MSACIAAACLRYGRYGSQVTGDEAPPERVNSSPGRLAETPRERGSDIPEVYQGPRAGQGDAPSAACACLERFIEVASALEDAWDPVLDRSSYPAYLPSFDEFVSALIAWRDEVRERETIAKSSDIQPVPFADATAVRGWLKEVRTQVDDGLGAGEDATRPLGRRTLGRRMARRKVMDAQRALLELFEAAERGLG